MFEPISMNDFCKYLLLLNLIAAALFTQVQCNRKLGTFWEFSKTPAWNITQVNKVNR